MARANAPVTARLARVREDLAAVPERVRVLLKVGRTSGLLWSFGADGYRALARIVAQGGSQNPSQIYRVHGANTPDKAAIVHRDRTITFAELDGLIDRLAAALQKRGITRGTSVVLMMRNRPEFLLAGTALTRIGAAAVAISWRSTPAEIAYLAGHCGARAVVFDHDLGEGVAHAHATASHALPAIDASRLFAVGGEFPGTARFEDLLHEGPANVHVDAVTTDDAAVVIYTSGTTGKPKGAVRKFPRDTFPAAMRFIAETPMRADDIHLVACPLYHSTAFGFLTLSHILGNTAVLLDEFKPEGFVEAVARHGVTTAAVVPTMLHRVLSLPPEVLARHDTRSLRLIFTGGAPLPPLLGLNAMDHFGDILFNFYGATETGLVTLGKPEDLRAAPGTIGRAVPGNDIRLLDDAGNEVPRGEVGELYVKNQLLVAGYHADDAATRASMREGYFSVGDLARQDRDGRYFIEGRKRDMIISGGVNVYPAEVEQTLEAHDAIAEVAVVGVPDEEWGERVRAFVVTKPGATLEEAELKAWARERLAGPKVPRDVVFLDQLPRNPTGKVLKRELRTWKR